MRRIEIREVIIAKSAFALAFVAFYFAAVPAESADMVPGGEIAVFNPYEYQEIEYYVLSGDSWIKQEIAPRTLHTYTSEKVTFSVPTTDEMQTKQTLEMPPSGLTSNASHKGTVWGDFHVLEAVGGKKYAFCYSYLQSRWFLIEARRQTC